MSATKPKDSFSTRRKILAALLVICAVALAVHILMSCQYMPGFLQNQDNIVEEIVESVIEDQTGVDIDFTPSSPE